MTVGILLAQKPITNKDWEERGIDWILERHRKQDHLDSLLLVACLALAAKREDADPERPWSVDTRSCRICLATTASRRVDFRVDENTGKVEPMSRQLRGK
jgi:hypothetical protein